nr:hypothetical protein [Tanacetum cinerariifolium]
MDFRDFLYAETDVDLSFHPKEPFPNFGLPDVLELHIANACHLKIFAITLLAWRGYFNNQAQELLKVFEQIKGECEVLKEREKARDKECEDLKAKCEAVMADFDNNPVMKVLHEKIADLFVDVKEHKASLVAEKAKLETTEASLRQEVENVKLDRAEVILKVVPYVAIKLVQSDDMGKLIVKRVSSAIFFGRCQAFQEVTRMKDLFDLTKIKGHSILYFGVPVVVSSSAGYSVVVVSVSKPQSLP